MTEYQDYIKRHGEVTAPADYRRLLSGIQAKVHRRRSPAARLTWSLAGACAVVLIGVWLYSALRIGSSDNLVDYALTQEKVNGDPLIAYVFGD